jgi:ATP-dependent DNA helicase Rep
LQISFCAKRKRGKEWASCEPSRFISELPQSEIVYAGLNSGSSATAVSKEAGMSKLAQLKSMLK